MVDEPFFDKDRRCRKCGASAYIEFKPWYWRLPISRIVRTCERCGYHWAELPLDHDADQEHETLRQWRGKVRAGG